MNINHVTDLLSFIQTGYNTIRWGSRPLSVEVMQAVQAKPVKNAGAGATFVYLVGRGVAEELQAMAEEHPLFLFFEADYSKKAQGEQALALGKLNNEALFVCPELRHDVIVGAWVKDDVLVEHTASWVKLPVLELGLRSFQCHKIVQAAKIETMSSFVGEGPITLHLEGNKSINVSRDWVMKHSPITGGYFVLYNDGYTSFSPADAFEDGYSRV